MAKTKYFLPAIAHPCIHNSLFLSMILYLHLEKITCSPQMMNIHVWTTFAISVSARSLIQSLSENYKVTLVDKKNIDRWLKIYWLDLEVVFCHRKSIDVCDMASWEGFFWSAPQSYCRPPLPLCCPWKGELGKVLCSSHSSLGPVLYWLFLRDISNRDLLLKHCQTLSSTNIK